MNKHQHTTRGIKHWGLSGYLNILPRIKFGVTRQESSPQSPTVSYRHRYMPDERERKHDKITTIKKRKNKNANAQSISFPALPCNRPFAVKHMLFCRRILLC